MASNKGTNTGRRRRFAPLVWLASVGAVAVLALGVSGTLSDWTAQINNSNNHVGTGSLVMQETGPDSSGTATTCSSSDSTATCSTINKYGNGGVAKSNLAPGDSVNTTVTINNTGTTDADTFTLTFAACSQTPTATAGPPVVGDLCSELQVAVYQGSDTTGTPIFTGTPTALAGDHTLTAADATTAGGSGQAYTFKVTLPSGADNTYQGVTASQAMTWKFAA